MGDASGKSLEDTGGPSFPTGRFVLSTTASLRIHPHLSKPTGTGTVCEKSHVWPFKSAIRADPFRIHPWDSSHRDRPWCKTSSNSFQTQQCYNQGNGSDEGWRAPCEPGPVMHTQTPTWSQDQSQHSLSNWQWTPLRKTSEKYVYLGVLSRDLMFTYTM